MSEPMPTPTNPVPAGEKDTPKVTTDNPPKEATSTGAAAASASADKGPRENQAGTSKGSNANGSGSEGVWMDVAMTNACQVDVTQGYKNNPLMAIAKKEGFVNLEMGDFEKGLELEPGVAYKFRVAAVNSAGVGPWSEVTAYRTLTPGLPTAPHTAKIVKTDNGGASISWSVPSDSFGTVKEYAVFVAVIKNGMMSFERVYQGPDCSCQVSKCQLANAVIDSSGGKPAVIFRIAARNEGGWRLWSGNSSSLAPG